MGWKLVLVLSMVLLTASPAAARTLVVDDDSGCADARYRTIQSAVDIARAGDVVRVCPGEYREEVELSQSRVTLRSRVPLAATIVGNIRASGEGIVIRGFTVRGRSSGAFPSGSDECDGAAILLLTDGEARNGPGSTILDNHVTQARCTTPSPAAGDGTAGIKIDDDLSAWTRAAVIAGNVVEDAASTGIQGCANDVDIHDNAVVGAGGNGIEVCGASNVRSNSVVGSAAVGIAGFGGEDPNAFRIVANRLADNDTGIAMFQIGAGVDGASPSFVERNRVTGSDSYGIADFYGVRYVTYRNNRASGSGAFDCYDASQSQGQVYGGNWLGSTNIGATANPRSICRPA